MISQKTYSQLFFIILKYLITLMQQLAALLK